MTLPQAKAEELTQLFRELTDATNPPGEFVRFRARRLAQEALARDPSDVLALDLRAALHVAAQEMREASEVFRRAFSIAPTTDRLHNCLMSFVNDGRAEEGLEFLDEALPSVPSYPKGPMQLRGVAALLAASGNPAAHAFYLEAIKRSDPDSTVDLLGLARVGISLHDWATAVEFMGRCLCSAGLLVWEGSGLESMRSAAVEDVEQYFSLAGVVVWQSVVNPDPVEGEEFDADQEAGRRSLVEDWAAYRAAANAAVLDAP